MKNKTAVLLGVVIIALLFLLLRENEAKVAAQNQLNKIQFKATSVINEKGNAINELETQLTELQVKLQETEENGQSLLAAKAQEMDQLAADSQVKVQQYEEEIRQKVKAIGDAENEAKESSERFEKTLKKKNTEISGMGDELRKTTERLATALKKQEADEAENFSQHQKISDFEKQVQALKDEQTRLKGLAGASKDTPAALD